MPPKTPKTVADKIESICRAAYTDDEKPSRQYIKKALAEKYDYTNDTMIKKTLGQMVKAGKLIQKGQTFYAPDFVPESELPKKWTPLHPSKKHWPEFQGTHSDAFPEHAYFASQITHSDKRSFWKLMYHMYQLGKLYELKGDEGRAISYNTAWCNMLDCSDHNYEARNRDEHGNYIGIGNEDMGTNMVPQDVVYLRDIAGVGASTLKLIEEWIETGKIKRLEDLKKQCSPSELKEIELDEAEQQTKGDEPEEFESKHDYTPDFLKALGELADIYEAEDDFRAKAFNKAKEALDGRIITAVDDIKLFNLIELPGVGKSTLEMFREFIETGKIEKLEELKKKAQATALAFWEAADQDLRKAMDLLTDKDTIKLVDDKISLNGRDRESYVCRGCPRTFEYKNDTYKIYGLVDIDGGGDRTIKFKGYISKNGGEPVKLSAECCVEVDMGCGGASFESISVEVDEKALGIDVEDIWSGPDLKEEMKEIFSCYSDEYVNPEEERYR